MPDNTSSKTSGNPAVLKIVLAKDTFLLPWSHFLHAEGGSDEIRMAFSTHNIVVTGKGLDKLIPQIISQQVDVLKEPSRADGFGHTSEYQIAGITAEKYKG
jgi:hypothetical protein